MSALRRGLWAVVLVGALLVLAGGGGLLFGTRHLASKAGLLVLGGALVVACLVWLIRRGADNR